MNLLRFHKVVFQLVGSNFRKKCSAAHKGAIHFFLQCPHYPKNVPFSFKPNLAYIFYYLGMKTIVTKQIQEYLTKSEHSSKKKRGKKEKLSVFKGFNHHISTVFVHIYLYS